MTMQFKVLKSIFFLMMYASSFFALFQVNIVGLEIFIVFSGISLLLFLSDKMGLPSDSYLFIITLFFLLALATAVMNETPMIDFLVGIIYTLGFCLFYLCFGTFNVDDDSVLDLFDFIIKITLFGLALYLPNRFLEANRFVFIPFPFRETGLMGVILSCSMTLSIYLYIRTQKKKYIIYAFMMFSIVALVPLLKSAGSMIAVIVLFVFATTNSERKKVIPLLVAGIILIFIGFGERLVMKIQSAQYFALTNADIAARPAMYVTSYRLALDKFPLGSGAGTFGSIPSRFPNYSSIYYDYGLDSIWGLRPEDALTERDFFLDTYWPHILGEYGFIGSALFLWLWVFPIMTANKRNVSRPDRFLIVALIIGVSIQGVALYAPESLLIMMFYSGISRLILRKYGI